jgi:hypothetical protein
MPEVGLPPGLNDAIIVAAVPPNLPERPWPPQHATANPRHRIGLG